MKRFFILMSFCFCVFSCSMEEDNYNLVVNHYHSYIGIMGGSLFLDIQSNSHWSVSTDADWIRVIPESGVGDGELTVLVSEAEEPREGKIQFTLPDGMVKKAFISQGNEEGFIKILEDTGGYNDRKQYKGGFVVLANKPWTLECEDWINVYPRYSKKYRTEVLYTVTGKSGRVNAHFTLTLNDGTCLYFEHSFFLY